MTSVIELTELRRQTAILIARRGQDIALWRKAAPTPSGAGGFIPAADPNAPLLTKKRFFQTTIMPASDRSDVRGEKTFVQFVIIGLVGDDIQENDWFFVNGRRYDIDFIDPDRTFQLKGTGVLVTDGS